MIIFITGEMRDEASILRVAIAPSMLASIASGFFRRITSSLLTRVIGDGNTPMRKTLKKLAIVGGVMMLICGGMYLWHLDGITVQNGRAVKKLLTGIFEGRRDLAVAKERLDELMLKGGSEQEVLDEARKMHQAVDRIHCGSALLPQGSFGSIIDFQTAEKMMRAAAVSVKDTDRRSRISDLADAVHERIAFAFACKEEHAGNVHIMFEEKSGLVVRKTDDSTQPLVAWYDDRRQER